SGEEQDSSHLHLQLADWNQLSDSAAADHAAQSSARPDSAAAHQPAAARPVAVWRRSREATDSASHHDGPGQGGRERRGRVLRRFARRHPLRRSPAGAPAGGRARRRTGVRRPLLRQERHSQDQARRIQAGLHADAQRSGLDSPLGEPMSADASAGGNPRRFYGKYRGLVIANIDPEHIGRVIVQVPAVLGAIPSSWAMPCVPAAGIQAGCFIVPPIGSQVWVEFEQGDPDYPIWTGGFWGLVAQVPILATAPPAIPPGQNIVLQTTGQNMIMVSDAPPTPVTGGIVLKSTTGAMLVVNDTGIYISNGKGAMITMIGPTVDVNVGALTVI